MHRGGGVVGGGGAGTAAGRVLELDHPPAIPAGPTGFHWGAMIAGHHAAAAAGMMQPSLSGTADYGLATTHSPAHSTMPMDLHMSQGFPCYRYRDEALCWTDRKQPLDNLGTVTSANIR
ncbi:uncharacterized protein LOC103570340 [Microplitis demolitor]|uniref:uncharacterized protein LOC103570340 n=1 Tax=Microplitis demolitor TaxID=69319 RepID=UPI0006D4FC75|nr:uncharacterized protein LOC103570340 [Microplitis demolitor]